MISELYKVRANGRELRVHAFQVATVNGEHGELLPSELRVTTAAPAAFCAFDMSGPIEVEVEAMSGEALDEAQIRPLRHAVSLQIDGPRARFWLSGAAKLCFEPDLSLARPLFLFANPGVAAATVAPESVAHYFGPGEHFIGVRELASGDTVYLHADATVHGHFTASCARDIRIFGGGVLDGSLSPGTQDRPITKNEHGEWRPLLRFNRCANIEVEGVHLIDSPNWTAAFFDCRDIAMRDVRIISWRENGDGIDFVNCERATVEDCFLRVSDDALVVKGLLSAPDADLNAWHAFHRDPANGNAEWNMEILEKLRAAPCRDIAFRNCVIWVDRAHALEIGFETSAIEIAGIRFEDIDIIHDLHLYPLDISLGDRAEIRDIAFRGIRVEDSRASHLVNLQAAANYCSLDPLFGLDYGRIQEVVFEDIEVLCDRLAPIRVLARPDGLPRLPEPYDLIFGGLPVLDRATLPGSLVARAANGREPGEPLIVDVRFNEVSHRGVPVKAGEDWAIDFVAGSEEFVADIGETGAPALPARTV